MGLFSKLGHGGVKVKVSAPSSIPSDQVIPVTVNITADSPHNIKSVKAEIKAQAREQGFGMGRGPIGVGGAGGVGIEDSRTTYQTVAQVESHDPLTVGPGDDKTVNLQLYINGSAGGRQSVGANGADSGLGGMLRSAANMLGNLDHVNYIYRVYASADVEGVALNPSDHQQLELLPPQGTAQPGQPIENLQANPPAPSPQAPPPPPQQDNQNPPQAQ